MTLPTLIQNHQNKALHSALLKNYSVLQTALQKANYEQGHLISSVSIAEKELKSLLMKELNAVKDCGNESCTSRRRSDDGSTNYVINNYKTYNNKIMATFYLDDGQFMLADGSLWMLENPGDGSLFITIDLNGPDKKPNKWGHDMFTFQIIRNGKVLPMGADGTAFSNEEFCSKNSNAGTNGIACTHRALTDKDYWKNLP